MLVIIWFRGGSRFCSIPTRFLMVTLHMFASFITEWAYTFVFIAMNEAFICHAWIYRRRQHSYTVISYMRNCWSRFRFILSFSIGHCLITLQNFLKLWPSAQQRRLTFRHYSVLHVVARYAILIKSRDQLNYVIYYNFGVFCPFMRKVGEALAAPSAATELWCKVFKKP